MTLATGLGLVRGFSQHSTRHHQVVLPTFQLSKQATSVGTNTYLPHLPPIFPGHPAHPSTPLESVIIMRRTENLKS